MSNNVTVTLEEPIDVGGDKVTEIVLRRPKAGELRSVKLLDLVQMEGAAVARVLTRISTPALSEAQVAGLDPADFMAIAVEIAAFLEPRAAQSPPT